MNRQKPVLLFTVFIDMICFGMIIPVLPYISKELHLSDFLYGSLAAVFPLMNFLFSHLWGSLSDRKGRRPVMLVSIAITLAANLLLAVTYNLPGLLLARIFAGIGSANFSVAQAYMSDITPIEQRTKNMGMIGAAFGLGFIFGPPLGGWLKDLSGPGSVLWVGLGAAILNLINLVSAWFFLKESNKNKNETYKRNLNPLKPIIKWLRVPVISQLMIIFFVYVVAFSMMQIMAGLIWKEKYFLTEAQAGYTFAYIGVTSAIFQGLLVGRLIKKYSERQLIIAGAILMAIGLASTPVPPAGSFVPWVFIIVIPISLGNALITPALSSWLSKKAPVRETGQVMGANQSFASMARVIGPTTGGLLYPIFWNLPFYTAGLIMLIPLFMIFRLKDD
jgi:MFS transporter, DHA1 family, tetracycline resistance protein